MRTFLSLLISLFAVNQISVRAQDAKVIEEELVKQFQQIDYWYSFGPGDENVSPSDSLLISNDIFEAALVKFTSANPATLNYDFTHLVNEGLEIIDSPDGQFRIYSWDSQTGGTMHFFRNVFQYKSNGRVYARSDSSAREPGDGGVNYLTVQVLKTTHKKYYLATYQSIASSKDGYQGIKAFGIVNNNLLDSVKLIRTSSGIVNSIGFAFDFFSVADRPERPLKLISYDADKKAIHLPVVLEDGTVTNTSIVYRFTGRYFEKAN